MQAQQMQAQQVVGDMATKATPQIAQAAMDNPEMAQEVIEQMQQ
jgi:hypothetical protein